MRYDFVFSASPLAGVETIALPRPVRRWQVASALRHSLNMPQLGRRTRETGERSATLGLHVLVAEDNLINQEVTLGMLADLGCTSLCVADGKSAVDALVRDRFDLVLMDCQMPVMDGFEATSWIRQRECPAARIPIVALTASATEADRRRCAAAGMDHFLAKPFRLDALEALVLEIVPRDGAKRLSDPFADLMFPSGKAATKHDARVPGA